MACVIRWARLVAEIIDRFEQVDPSGILRLNVKAPEAAHMKVLTPYDPREGISLAAAARRAGKSETTIRNWCPQHGLGRRVGGGVWVVSQVALAMFLDGDEAALAAYHAGDHSNLRVVRYVDRFGVPLPKPSKCPE